MSNRLERLFHWQDGWFFGRLPNGDVRIVKTESAKTDAPIEINIVLPSASWCSIIASVSDTGETSAKWDEAHKFHGVDF